MGFKKIIVNGGGGVKSMESMSDLRSEEGWSKHGLSVLKCCFLEQEILLYIVSTHPGV